MTDDRLDLFVDDYFSPWQRQVREHRRQQQLDMLMQLIDMADRRREQASWPRPEPRERARAVTNSEQQLVRLAETLDELDDKRAAIVQRRDALIAQCFQTGELGATRLAKASGLSTAGVYKVRNRETRGGTQQ